MNEDNPTEGLYNLLDQEINYTDKIMKPDFSKKDGRELLANYLKNKFRKVLKTDSKLEKPVFLNITEDFINSFADRLITNPDKRIMICITGESASGKSTICHEISNFINQLDIPVTILTTDNYFNDISFLIKECGSFDALRDNGYDLDSPSSFQLDVLKQDLEQISQGIDIYSPEYLLNGTGVSVPKAKFLPSNKIVIVEGIASMYNGIQDIFDVKIYVETSPEIRKERFLKRAYTERCQDLENAKKHWEYILVAGEKYVKPAKDKANMVLSGDIDLKYFCKILRYLYKVTNNFKENN